MNGNSGDDRTNFSSRGSGLSDLLWRRRSKWGKFGLIVVVLLLLSSAASLVARLTVFQPASNPSHRIALIAPLSGSNEVIGRSMRDGAKLFVDGLAKSGQHEGAVFALDVYDDAGEPAKAKEIAEKLASLGNVVAAIGTWSERGTEQAAEILERAQIPLIVPTRAQTFASPRKWSFSTGYSRDDETRFLANYVRNVSGDVLASIISSEPRFNASAELFQKTYERFGAPIRHRWKFDATTADPQTRMLEIAREVKAAPDSGTLYLAMDPGEAARLIRILRDNGVVNKLVGPSQLGTRAFAEAFGSVDFDRYVNGVMTAAPLLFDTANAQAQNFRTRYLSAYRTEPDWVAAVTYESAHIIAEAVRETRLGKFEAVDGQGRSKLRDYLSTRNQAEDGIKGLTGVTVFDSAGIGARPIQVGLYDGRNLVSALTQLQPIGRDEVANYIQVVREGRALYVNDRFMYRTNVVYSGMLIKEIRKFDKAAGTFEMDFTVWFRYRGDFQPQDVIFANAVEPIKLATPDRSEKVGELSYLSYNLVGKFNANFLKVQREYGTDLLGTSFRHRILDRNNLLYVVDVIGMDLVGRKSLLDKLRDTRALSPSLGMVPERAWIGQDTARSDGLGALTFVGHGKPQPNFSQIVFGVVTQTGAPSIRDMIPNEFLIYVLIFAFIGSVFAVVMDRNRKGRELFWSAQTWILRAVCWPLLLISAGGLMLNMAFGRLEFYQIDLLVLAYHTLLWLMPAALAAMAIERFMWSPMEKRTQRKVPGSVRALVAILIYVFAGFGVIAFVLNHSLTSLLATSGVLAMVCGLALQGNIANIFSGIVLNLERPFQVGDILRLRDGTEAEVMDITWRSIRVRSGMGRVYSIPNTVATQSEMIRVTRASGEPYRMSLTVYVSPQYNPAHVTGVIQNVLQSIKSFAPSIKPTVRFGGTMLSPGGAPFAAFSVGFASAEYSQKDSLQAEVWSAIWQALNAEGISMGPDPMPPSADNVPRAQAAE